MKKYFGTDGIRGIPNKNLTKEIVSNVTCSVEDILKPTSVAVILDTRDSSLEILDWICEGFSENIEDLTNIPERIVLFIAAFITGIPVFFIIKDWLKKKKK